MFGKPVIRVAEGDTTIYNLRDYRIRWLIWKSKQQVGFTDFRFASLQSHQFERVNLRECHRVFECTAIITNGATIR